MSTIEIEKVDNEAMQAWCEAVAASVRQDRAFDAGRDFEETYEAGYDVMEGVLEAVDDGTGDLDAKDRLTSAFFGIAHALAELIYEAPASGVSIDQARHAFLEYLVSADEMRRESLEMDADDEARAARKAGRKPS